MLLENSLYELTLLVNPTVLVTLAETVGKSLVKLTFICHSFIFIYNGASTTVFSL